MHFSEWILLQVGLPRLAILKYDGVIRIFNILITFRTLEKKDVAKFEEDLVCIWKSWN